MHVYENDEINQIKFIISCCSSQLLFKHQSAEICGTQRRTAHTNNQVNQINRLKFENITKKISGSFLHLFSAVRSMNATEEKRAYKKEVNKA